LRLFHDTIYVILVAVVIAGLAPANRLRAQEVAVETKLTVEDAAEGAEFGAAIAVDGDVMAVAAPGADVGGGPGSARSTSSCAIRPPGNGASTNTW
jgi:FG-GAP repeat